MSGSWITYPNFSSLEIPDDLEKDDKEDIGRYIDSYMSYKYPKPSLEIFSTFEKQYWLPALKVLEKGPDGIMISPKYKENWVDGELVAECKSDSMWGPGLLYTTLNASNYAVVETTRIEGPKHEAPHEACECGIYGSVNIDEILMYCNTGISQSLGNNYRFPEDKALCIIEPYPDAKTIICRKGWKTSHAFISEIVYETISWQDASHLLSMVWNRNIDIRRIYENR